MSRNAKKAVDRFPTFQAEQTQRKDRENEKRTHQYRCRNGYRSTSGRGRRHMDSQQLQGLASKMVAKRTRQRSADKSISSSFENVE